MAKKELQVAAIENGTVIDHIPAEKTYQVAHLLTLHDLDVPAVQRAGLSVGMRSMAARAERMGARFSVDSAPGVTVVVGGE